MNTKQESIVQKVRNLMAKAEDPAATRHERELFSAKAEELVARYAIDLALLEEKQGKGKPVLRTVDIDGTYGKPKHLLFQQIAKAYGCRAVRNTPVTEQVVGFEGDLDIVETLYHSLVLQGVNAMLSEYRSDRSFRSAFMYGFATRAGTRLRDMRAKVDREVREEDAAAGTGTALVLADRSREVNAAAAEHFGRVTSTKAGARDRSGHNAGASAANRADVGGARLGGSRRALV